MRLAITSAPGTIVAGSRKAGHLPAIGLPLAALLLSLVAAASPAAAQSAKLAEDPPPPYAAASEPAATDSPAPAEPANPSSGEPARPSSGQPDRPTLSQRAPAEPAGPIFDPLHASKSLDVANFYMKRGEYDAAIDRYEEAARFNPKLAMPYLMLGEIYEKKSDSSDAVIAYRKYLELYSTAPDRDKIQKRIDKLASKTKR
jgi:tetratricopeptide (TPR) repeat protein